MFAALSTFEKFYWFLAVPATVFFLLMTIVTFAGMGGADDIDGDVDVDGSDMDGGDVDAGALAGFHFFTVRNFIVFFMMFGWSGIAMIRSGAGTILTIGVSAAIGLVMMFVVSFLFLLIARMVHSGNVSITAVVGAQGSVYLTVPEKRSGTGKVTVVAQGKKIEYKAMTDGETIKTGASVRVTGLINNETVRVERS